MDLVCQEMIAGVFKQCVPPDTRMWMSDGLKIDVVRDVASMSTRVRIAYRPTARVVPEETLQMEMVLDEVQFQAVAKGQFDFIDVHSIGDFFLKMLMVYSLEPFEFSNGNWGANAP